MVPVDLPRGSPLAGHASAERGWSLNFLRAGGVAATLSALLVVGAFSPATTLAAGYDPATDPHSMAALTSISGAKAWWDAGYTGQGVDVAVIDTGVSQVPGLDATGKVIYGPDLSLESQSNTLRYLDGYGHGTFMAGVIAGHDAALTAPYSAAPASAYRGMAPDARIVSVKVGVADGGTDVTQVIAAIDWVVQHRNDNGMNIRVINLSYGTNSAQAYTVDPLAYAAEQAWKKGIVVVAAAGNTGFQRGNKASGLADPAYDPYLIGVGGYDSMGTSAFADDRMGSYSASSSVGWAKNPDSVAVGSHLQGLRVPGSFIDQNHPEGLLGDRYFRGSGTSEAAAVTSGAVALVLSKYPALTPDQVKAFIASGAQKLRSAGPQSQGAGELQLGPLLASVPAKSTQAFKNSTGTGSVEAARGSDHLTLDGVVLTGEQDIFGAAFDATAMAAAEAAATSWSDGIWNGRSWTGRSWTGRSWTTVQWQGNSWSGRSWTGLSWSDNAWDGRSWTGRSWTGSSFSGRSWTGATWATGSWS